MRDEQEDKSPVRWSKIEQYLKTPDFIRNDEIKLRLAALPQRIPGRGMLWGQTTSLHTS